MLNKYSPAIVASVIISVIVWLIFPYYQYYIDPDATSYLTIARRYATGDVDRAINGYWGPWSTWIAALFMKSGFAAMAAAIVTNTIAACLFMFISQSFFLKGDVSRRMQWLLNGTLTVFLVYAVYYQNFADLWMFFFLLAGVRVMLLDKFLDKPFLWLVLGVLGTLAYFSKAFAFPFFILNTIVCLFFISGALSPEGRKLWLKIAGVSIIVMVVCSLPWIYMLHEKYGVWSTGSTGKLNLSWYLVGHPYWADGINVLLPPVYEDSPYYWEDPLIANGDAPQFYSSIKLFALQIVKAGFNLLKLFTAMGAISVLYAATWLVAIALLFSNRIKKHFSGSVQVMAVTFLLFPLPYILINYEPRYIWYTISLSLVFGALAIDKAILLKRNPSLRLVVSILFVLSYIVTPILGLKEMYRQGEDAYKAAQVLRDNNINGSFASNANTGAGGHFMQRVAYHTGNSFYTMPKPASEEDIFSDMQRYGVEYYYYMPDTDIEFQLSDTRYSEVFRDTTSGLRVYKID